MSAKHQSDPTLLRWYRRFNHLYFGGALPTENVVLCWEPWEGESGSCDKIYEGVTDRETDDFIVRIDPRHQGSRWSWKIVLLHEMAHIKLWPYNSHGKRFDDEIVRLCGFKSYRRLL